MTDPTLWVLVLVFAAGAGLVWKLQRGPVNIRIVVRDGHPHAEGRGLSRCRAAVEEFVRQDLGDVRSARIEGFYAGRGRRLRLRCQGLTVGQQQRLRNFLLTVI